MNFRFGAVETSLNRAEFRWKWLRFIRHSSVLGLLLCLFLTGLALAVRHGWLTNRTLAVGFFVALLGAALVAWVIIIIGIAAKAPDRRWLAGVLERIDPRLLDRLNTLLFLEPRRGEAQAESFSVRIARQAHELLVHPASPTPFSSTRSMAWLLAFTLMLAATTIFYLAERPWNWLEASTRASAPVVPPEKPLELAFPTNNAEPSAPWGEVRIVEPGADLQVTKVDVVPLEIEAAANQALKRVDWVSTVNGSQEMPHELPPPKEPRYAAYQPTLYLDEFNLADWDVLTYYAKAKTAQQGSFASEVYFLEVRPFREDMQKMPGGASGQAYQTLNEISTLISRQEHVIRQTHQHIQKPPDQENLRAQDRGKLADAENELASSSQHLYARMAAQMENQPIGEALDNLAKAQTSLGQSSKLLADNVMSEAPNRERGALSELIAARKIFQKAVTDNPDAFGQPDREEQASPTAGSTQKLNEMAEFRNESKAAQEFVQKTLDQQRNLQQQTRSAQSSDYPRLAGLEQNLNQSLQDFQAQHPQPFKGVEAQSQEARQAMAGAAGALEQRNAESPAATQKAARMLEQFGQALQQSAAERQLADAYRLKHMLDRQIQTLDQRAQGAATVSDADLERTAREARDTVKQLANSAEQEPTRNSFGQPLRDALSGQNGMEIEVKLRQLQQAQEQAEKQQRAGEARDKLSGVSNAFAASQPKSTQMAGAADSLKPSETDSFGQGLAELESLLKHLEQQRPLPAQDQAKQGQQALANLQSGLRSRFGTDTRGQELLDRLRQLLAQQAPPEPEALKSLIAELQRFSLEAATQLARQQEPPELTHIDASRLPPAYRGRIQKYFEKLSEK